jgi:peptidoglycan/xylan/chitin deacetylase (PgdA/CDA1 family)
MLTFTTSWDDGDPLDEKLADLLDRFSIRGTFYMPQEFEGARRSTETIKKIAGRHEIGAHTLKHTDLRKVSLEQARVEITGSKQWLEELTGGSVEMFCYPGGKYTKDVRDIVARSGYIGARTTEQFSTAHPSDPFEVATTVQIYPFPLRFGAGIRAMFGPARERLGGFRSLGVPLLSCRSWRSAAIAAFDRAHERGGVFHLWGHSWEIERYGMWKDLEAFLSHVAAKGDSHFLTNGELVKSI